MLDQPNPDSPDPKDHIKKDGARELLKLVVQNYLPLRNVDLWKSDPENYIEHEDELYYMLEYDMDAECTMSLLAYQFLEKIVQKFYEPCLPMIHDELLSKYLSGNLKPENEMIEDSLLCLVGMIGKVQKERRERVEKRLDVC